MKFRAVCSIIVLLLSTGSARSEDAEEILSDLRVQQSVAVTIYNENLALVKDQRVINFGKGFNKLAYSEVSALIRPETALLNTISNKDSIYVIEQNFDFDLLTPQKLLEKHVGEKVNIVTDKETVEEAIVLSASNGVILKIGDRIETGVPGRIVYKSVPPNLRARPTLVLQLMTDVAGPQKVELSYLTGGLSWKADYVAELSANGENMDLTGWVTLTNTSGASYNKAKLQLVAGDIHRVREAIEDYRDVEVALMAKAARPQMAEEGLFEYHLYTLERPTTIAENQTKQVSLLSAASVPVAKEFVLKGADYYYHSNYGDLGQKMKVGVFMEFENKESSRLGMPLPKGIIRVYKKDSKGNAQFVGEDRIDHAPKNEKVRLKLGDAFDITADKKQTDFNKIGETDRHTYIYESSFQIDIKNAKKEAVMVAVQEPIPGDWKIISESHPHRKEAGGTAVWDVKVPAEGKATLKYRVRVKF